MWFGFQFWFLYDHGPKNSWHSVKPVFIFGRQFGTIDEISTVFSQDENMLSNSFLFEENNSIHSQHDNSVLTSSGYSTEDSFMERNIDINENFENSFTMISMPSSFKVRQSFPNAFRAKKYNVEALIHHGERFSDENIRKMYSNVLKKYFSILPMIRGKITDYTNRIIQTSSYITDMFLFGSDEHKERLLEETAAKINQNGQICLSIFISYPLNNPETIASYLVQKKFVVTENISGNEQNIYERKFEVHNHKADSNCSENCNKISLNEFISHHFDIRTIKDDIVPTYVFNCLKKMKEFIHGILNCANFQLKPEEFSFRSVFKDNGEMQLIGIIWPKEFKHINLMISNVSYGLPWDENIVKDVLKKLEEEVTTRTDLQYFQENLGLSHLIAEKARNLSNKEQVHFNRCSTCKMVQLPSFISLITQPYPTYTNIFPSKRLKSILNHKLHALTLEQKENLRTMDFLYECENDSEVIREGRMIKLITSNENLIFDVDETMNQLLANYRDHNFIGIYLYSLMFSETTEIYLKKVTVKEVYTHPYTYLFLQAARAMIEVLPTSGISSFLQNYYGSRDIVESNLEHHRIIPLAEAILTLDGRCQTTQTSQGTCFLRMNMNPSSFFNVKKLSRETDHSLTEEGKNTQFEKVYSMKEKFFKRLNAQFITLAEFLMWYEKVKDNSTERFLAYKDNKESIPDTEVANFDETDFLPEVILISTGDVVEFKKKRKVLQVTYEDMSLPEKQKCQYILYSKYLRTEDVDQDDVNDMLEINVYCDNIALPLMESRKKRLFPCSIRENY